MAEKKKNAKILSEQRVGASWDKHIKIVMIHAQYEIGGTYIRKNIC